MPNFRRRKRLLLQQHSWMEGLLWSKKYTPRFTNCFTNVLCFNIVTIYSLGVIIFNSITLKSNIYTSLINLIPPPKTLPSMFFFVVFVVGLGIVHKLHDRRGGTPPPVIITLRYDKLGKKIWSCFIKSRGGVPSPPPPIT